MNLQLVRTYGILIAGLALLGLFANGHLFGLMNTDAAIDWLRVLLAAYLLYVGFIHKTATAVDSALVFVGVLYIAMGLAGLVAPTLGGLLPSGLTGFDVAFHLITGGLATVAGLRRGEHHYAAHS